MPVPKRRKPSPMETLANLPSLTLQLFNADFVFQKTKWLFYYGFAPVVIYMGMNKEPCPSSWLELINILE